MGWNGTSVTPSSVIDDMTATAAQAAGKGYQPPGPCVASDPDYPTWLKGIVYLQASGFVSGATITENAGLITKPCESGGTNPTATLSANPTSITSGQSSTLTWSSTNATSCTGTNFTASGTSGSVSVSPTVTATYSVTCTGAGGTSSPASATVTVGSNPPPTATLSANPTSITSGQSSTLTWSSTNATSCTGTNFTASGTSGSVSVSPTVTTNYSITCTGAGGTSPAASATVTVTTSGGTITIGDTNIESVNDGGNGNLLLAQQATLGQTATIQSLSFYVRTTGGNLRLGIYDATGSGGSPGALKATTNSFTPTTGWNTQNVVTPVSLPAGTYWLAYFPSSNNLGFQNIIGTGQEVHVSRTYGALPATFPATGGANPDQWSFYATLNTGASDTTPPSTPTNLSASAVSSSQINLTWTTSTDPDNTASQIAYKVFRGGTQVGTTAAGVTSYSDTGLSPSTAYSYTVSANDPAGNNSAQSTSASATTQASPPPTVVLSAAPQSIGTGDSSTLTWNSTSASSCTGTNFSTGGATSGSAVVTPSATTVYSISCTGTGGTGTNTVTISVGALSALPTIDFPTGTFTWTTTNAVSCTASGGWTGSLNTNGTYTFNAPGSATYILTCTGGGTETRAGRERSGFRHSARPYATPIFFDWGKWMMSPAART